MIKRIWLLEFYFMRKFLIENIALLLVIVLLCFSVLFNVVKFNYRVLEVEKSVEKINEKVCSINRILAGELGIPEKHFEKFVDVCERYDIFPVLLNNIIKCESGWDFEAKNPKSTAKGLCQFLDGTWNWTLFRMGIDAEKADRFDPELQLEACAWLISNDDLGHWEETRQCWQDYQVNN